LDNQGKRVELRKGETPVEPKDGKQIKHGVNAYKRNICRCEKCTKANADYEKIARNKNRGNYPRPSFNQDTMTLEQFKKFRAKA
jgi:hypothetical protein